MTSSILVPGKLRRVAIVAFWLLLSALALATPARSWEASCMDLCEAATAFQRYGTGAEDLSCLAVCSGEAKDCSNAKGSDLWAEYFLCLEKGSPVSACRQAWVNAKECSVCDQGEVAPWSPADVVFVNEPNCQKSGPQKGTLTEPFCDFYDGLYVAIDRQDQGLDTKVLVCEGIYREGWEEIDGLNMTTSAAAKVVVEGVTRDSAVISGSELWSGAWQPVTEVVTEEIHNELQRTRQLDHHPWTESLVTVAPEFINDPPTFAASPASTKVFRIEATQGTEGPGFFSFYQQIPPLEDRLVTYSIYVRPDELTRFTLEFRLSNNGQEKAGAFYSVQLPPDPLCDTSTSSGAESAGVENAGNGWFRVHLTQRVDTHPSLALPNGVSVVRFNLLPPFGLGDGAQIFAPQLDHRPLDQFDASPRAYLEGPGSSTVSTVETFYVNDPSKKNWTHDWGLARHGTYWGELLPVMRRSEMVFVNGEPLRQELAEEDMAPGSFRVLDFVSYGDYNHKDDKGWISGGCSEQVPCDIRILPPPGVNMDTAKVEVAVRPRLLWLHGVRNWEVRGLHFQHSTGAYDSEAQGDCLGNTPADCRFPLISSAVAFVDSEDLTLLENRFDWSSSYGLGVFGRSPIPGNDIVLSGNSANDNGFGGEQFATARGFTVAEEEFSRNNWKGRRVGYAKHVTTGAKYSRLSEGTITGISAQDNFGHGLWFDHENQAVTVTNCTLLNNTGKGLYFEANDEWCVAGLLPFCYWALDPTTTVTGCTISGGSYGIYGISSRAIEVDGNVIYGNDVAIALDGTPRLEAPPRVPKHLRDWTLTHNTITATCPHHRWLSYGDKVGEQDEFPEWELVMESLHSDDNDFKHPLGASALGFQIKGATATFSEWQACDPSQAGPPAPADWCFQSQDQGSSLIP